MSEIIDFSPPKWLLIYYHSMGTVSLLFDAFSLYLVLFKSTKVDNFRYFLLNFQVACSFTDFYITFLMQPVPLYPLFAGYVVGFLPKFLNVNLHTCITLVIFLYIYQVASMIVCFVRKNQIIAGGLESFRIPKLLQISLLIFLSIYTSSVVGLYYCLSIPEHLKLEYVEEHFPQYLNQFKHLPNFSIYEVNNLMFLMVIIAVCGGLLAFLFLILVLVNIFRMFSFLKSQISTTNYKKHRAAVSSLLAQFATSSVCFLPPISLAFVVFFKLPNPQVIVEWLLVIACLHSSLNVTVLVATFPPYRRFVKSLIWCIKNGSSNLGLSSISQKPSVVISHLSRS